MNLLGYLNSKSDHVSADIDTIKEQFHNTKLKTNMNILSVNVRSLRRNFNDLCTMIDALDCFFSVIILNETWLDKGEERHFKLRNYNIYCNHRNKNGGCVLMYLAKSLKANIIPEATIITSNLESLFLNVTHPDRDNLTIGTIYRPPSSSIKLFNKDLESKILPHLSSSKLLISGDFNINLSANITPPSLEFAQIMLNMNLKNLITSPTRIATILNNDVPTTTSSVIDHVWTNLPYPPRSFVIEYNLTDHYPTICSINQYRNSDIKTFTFRTFYEANQRLFIQRFREFSQNLEISHNTDIDEIFDKVLNFLRLNYRTISY